MLAAGKRIVLAPIEPNEPVLASKLTGPGSGRRCRRFFTKHEGSDGTVSDIEGVAGFVLPGDRVDILLTRRVDKRHHRRRVAEYARVAIDQLADEPPISPRSSRP